MQGQHIPQLAMHWANGTSTITTLSIIIIFHLLMCEPGGFSRYHVLFRADQRGQRAWGFPSWSGWDLPSYRWSQMNRTLPIKSWVCRKGRASDDPRSGGASETSRITLSAHPVYYSLRRGDRLQISESDVCRHQIMTSKVFPRTERV